nr:MAG TPA: hypothetical protein [Caudoviricetes sp.]
MQRLECVGWLLWCFAVLVRCGISFSVCWSRGWRSVKCTGVRAWRSARFAAEPRIGG